MGIEKNDQCVNVQKKKILYVASEVYPLIKTGGLADVAGCLPISLAKLGHDIRVLLPCYANFRDKLKKVKTLLTVVIDDKEVTVLESKLPASKVTLWLCEYSPYYDRNGSPYSDAEGELWPDNAQRFDLLCKVAAMLACDQFALGWSADVVHCNDWQTGLIPVYLQQYQPHPGSLFTIHNLAYQGLFPRQTFDELGLDESLWSMHGLEFYDQLSFMKGGLVFADQINTVSPSYANEIQTPEFGNGLDGLLRYRQQVLSGILNGIDTGLWNPGKDTFIDTNYTSKSIDLKLNNKRSLQTLFNFPKNKDVFLIGMVGRMVEQKGLDDIISAIPQLAEWPIQIIILGCGDRAIETKLISLARQYADVLSVKVGYSEALSHKIMAGVDAFLMPSIFEPCGLSQMYSLRYGTSPIVRKVGGLADTVIDYVVTKTSGGKKNNATGFVIREHDGEDLTQAIVRAYQAYLDKSAWLKLQRNAMRQDFSWKRSAADYLDLYSKATQFNRQPRYAVQ